MGNQGQMVRKYMAMRLKQWENEPNDARVKGELAQLRHGIGKKPGEVPEMWELLFNGFPEELMSRNGEPS